MSARRAAISASAPAKINLYLHVVGRRSDGYHLLDSLVAFADVGDMVTAMPADRLELTVGGPFGEDLSDGPDNLVLKAASRLRDALGFQGGARLGLDKQLPVASGIGGGSADAAAALRVLAELWRADLGDPRLRDLALGLGADVPVCLSGRAVFMGGIGEVLTPAPPLPETWMVLVNPGLPVATPDVFKARRGAFSAPAPFDRPPASAEALAALLADRRNDLTAAAIAVEPEIRDVLEAIGARPGCLLARMSGSGATCYGLFADVATATRAADNLADEEAAWWVRACRLLPTGGA